MNMFRRFKNNIALCGTSNDKRKVVWLEEKPNVWRIVYADDTAV